MFKNKSFLWWILVGWWIFLLYIITIGWIIEPVKYFSNKNKNIPKYNNLNLIVAGTYFRKKEIEEFMKKNSENLWDKISPNSRTLFKYKSIRNYSNVELIREPNNEYDSNAIAVVLDGFKVGYISSNDNIQVGSILKNIKNISADINGGDFKKIDKDGDLIKILNDYNITIHLSC